MILLWLACLWSCLVSEFTKKQRWCWKSWTAKWLVFKFAYCVPSESLWQTARLAFHRSVLCIILLLKFRPPAKHPTRISARQRDTNVHFRKKSEEVLREPPALAQWKKLRLMGRLNCSHAVSGQTGFGVFTSGLVDLASCLQCNRKVRSTRRLRCRAYRVRSYVFYESSWSWWRGCFIGLLF